MIDRLKGLVREPALLIDLFETGLVLLVAFGLSLTGDQQSYLVAAIVALLGLLKGFMTTPFPVTVLTDFGRAVLVCAMAFGLNINDNQVAIVVTFLGTLVTLVQRAQISPRNDPVIAPHGSGAGPVTKASEVGAAAVLFIVGVCLLVVGALLLLLVLLDEMKMQIWVPLIIVVAGVVCMVLDGRSSRRPYV